MEKCEKHNRELKCMAGRNAHPSNWYCPECEKDEEESNKHIGSDFDDFLKEEGILEEAKLKAKLRLELATYEDGMVPMEDFINQIITVCNIHFIANSSVGEEDD